MAVFDVANALLDNKMVILRVPSDLPWRHSMRSAIDLTFKEHSNFKDIVIEQIDVLDDNYEQLEPGKFILERFASSTIKKGYREGSKVSIQDYISSKSITKNRIIWLKGLDKNAAEKWIRFCRGFSARTVADGLFVLEVCEDVPVNEIGSLKCVNFADCVSNYDVQLFNSFILDEKNCYTISWKKYISTCAATVCDIDAEISSMLLQVIDFKKEEVLNGIKNIAEMEEFLRRGKDGSSKHILWYYRSGKLSEIEHRIWAAQVQVLFPVIEIERVSLIQKYKTEIQNVLDSDYIEQYHEQLTNALDTELGTLCYLMSRKEDGMYILYIPDEGDRKRIKFLHDCRNKLAHAVCCSPGQIYELLGKDES